MKKRETLRMGGGVLKIVLKPGGVMPDRLGEFDPNTPAISLRDDLSANKRCEIFFHELTHRALDNTAFRYLSSRREEAICEAVAKTMMELFSQNPAFVRLLIRESK